MSACCKDTRTEADSGCCTSTETTTPGAERGTGHCCKENADR